jgi:tRNA threonylcarbamoyladenosine biosynthesis protein TsaE
MSADVLEILSNSESETEAAGERVAATLELGDILLLHGQLGADKTAFVRGLARGLRASPDDVSSPTFTLIQEYRGGRLPLFHVDLYRLAPAEVEDLGLDEMISGHGVVAIEWAERWTGRPTDAIRVVLEDRGEDRRTISITPPPRIPPPAQ